MSLSPSQGSTCSSARTFNVPGPEARATIIGSGQGPRLVDGDDGRVECNVSNGSAAGEFNVTVTLSSGEIGSLLLRGAVTLAGDAQGTGTFRVDFTTTQFSLTQTGCTATVEEALPGAVWVSNLTCPDLGDPSSPSIACVGTGGFIAENCSR